MSHSPQIPPHVVSEPSSVLLILCLFLHLPQVKKLQLDISPLHHSLSQLSEKNGSLQADQRILEEDLKRWKAKAQVTVCGLLL